MTAALRSSRLNHQIDAIILAGGFGTRLRAVVQDLPKPMAPVAGRPFLSYLLDTLVGTGIGRVILSTGYRHEAIESFFGEEFRGMQLLYSREETPLGTGGAIRMAMGLVQGDLAFVFNGDTFFEVDLEAMRECHRAGGFAITIALKRKSRAGRYGKVRHRRGRVTGFLEKGSEGSGLINGGIYVLNPRLFEGRGLPERFSLEQDFLEKECDSLQIGAFISPGYFLDIGLPRDYTRAQKDLPRLASTGSARAIGGRPGP